MRARSAAAAWYRDYLDRWRQRADESVKDWIKRLENLKATAMNAAAGIVEVRVPDMGNFKDVAIIDVLVKPGEKIEPEALRKEFGSEIEILGAEAGMHLVITLPPGLSDQKISRRAAQDGLWLWPLSSAYVGTNVRQGFILGFGGTKAEEMLPQVRRLRKVIRDESGYRGLTQSGH